MEQDWTLQNSESNFTSVLSRNNAMNKDKNDTPQSFLILQAMTSSETLKLQVLS